VGGIVGENVGLVDGLLLGSIEVGRFEGDVVGRFEGKGLGISVVDARVGDTVGLSDGDLVGTGGNSKLENEYLYFILPQML